MSPTNPTTRTDPQAGAPPAGTPFDAERYKVTTTEQWQQAAEAWHRWDPFIDQWLGAATELMLDLAGIETDSQVLDVAAGSGGQSIVAARRVGPGGEVRATDISPAILELAARSAIEAGLANVTTQVADGEELAVPAGSFDAAISRVGLIYFPDQQAALAAMRRALRPGGRIAAVVYSTPERNPFFSVPVGLIRRRARSCRHRSPANRAPSAWGRPASSRPPSVRPGSRTSRSTSSRPRCDCGRPPSASSSSASRSEPCTRCSRDCRRPNRNRPGPRSRRPCPRSRDPPGSRDRVRWWSRPAPVRREGGRRGWSQLHERRAVSSPQGVTRSTLSREW